MLNTLLTFFHMGGYGYYVWLSYGSVLAFLAWQLIVPWRQLRKYRREQHTSS